MAVEHRVILVRHSLPELDSSVPAREWHLSAVGRRRCRPLAQRLAAYGPAVIVSSEEPKAVETAEIVGQVLDLPTGAAPGLHEHDRSNTSGLDVVRFRAAIQRLFAHPDDLVYGCETADQARRRFAAAVDGVLDCYPDVSLAVVTHGTVLSLYAAGRAGCDAYALWQRLGLPSFVVLSRSDLGLLEVVEDVLSA